TSMAISRLNPEYRRQVEEAYHLAKQYVEQKLWSNAEDELNKLVSWGEGDARLWDLLARSLNGQQKWWQEIGALRQALGRGGESGGGMHYRLGAAQEALGHSVEAAGSFARAISFRSGVAPAEWFYRWGYNLETAAHDGAPTKKQSASAYRDACA